MDNILLIHLCRPANVRLITSAGLSLGLTAALVSMVLMLRSQKQCAWCGMHFPVGKVYYGYLVAAAAYFTIAALASYAPPNWIYRQQIRALSVVL